MWRFLLTYDGDQLILDANNNTAPRGFDKMGYTLQVSDNNNMVREFSEKLGFNKAARTWIQDKIDANGLDILITCLIQRKDINYRWETIITSKLNVANFLDDEHFLDVNVEDDEINVKLKLRSDNEIDYNSNETIDGTIVPGFTSEFFTCKLAQPGTAPFSYTDYEGVLSFEALTKLLQKILDVGYMVLKSSIFGRSNLTSNGFSFDYPVNGDLSYIVISKGLLISGIEPNSDTSKVSGKTDLVLQFNKLFKAFNSIIPLGMRIETISDIKYVIIERLSDFFQNSQYSFTIEKNEISNFRIETIKEFFNNKITAGSNDVNNDNERGLTDYTAKVEYTTPLKNFEGTYMIISDYSTSPGNIEKARVNPVSGRVTDQENIDTDEKIFLIDSYLDGGIIYSRDNTEGFISVSGVYGTDPIYTNLRIRATQNIDNHGWLIKTGLQFNSGEFIKFQDSKSLSKVVSQLSGHSNIITDNEDISIDTLSDDSGSPIFTGYKHTFDSPLTISRLQEMQANTKLLVKYWNIRKKEYSYGWWRKASTNPTDGSDTSWEIWESITPGSLPGGFIQFMDSSKGNIEFMDSSKGYIEFMAS